MVTRTRHVAASKRDAPGPARPKSRASPLTPRAASPHGRRRPGRAARSSLSGPLPARSGKEVTKEVTKKVAKENLFLSEEKSLPRRGSRGGGSVSRRKACGPSDQPSACPRAGSSGHPVPPNHWRRDGVRSCPHSLSICLAAVLRLACPVVLRTAEPGQTGPPLAAGVSGAC